MTLLDPAICHRALRSRDPRFDGRLFVGIVTTGIYCRPVCPAPSARPENCRFFPSAAAAQQAGFRPCLRCRPETAPEVGTWRGTANTVGRALALIAAGELDDEEAGVEQLAERLGVGARQLRRLFSQHLGASPIAVAQTRRVLFAKQLLHETELPMAQVALAAGFGSVRRFNETFRALFARPPSALRRRRAGAAAEPAAVTVRLRYRAPFDWPALVAHLAARAVEGVERVEDGRYARTIALDGQLGTVEVSHLPAVTSLAATIRLPSVRALGQVVARLRCLFDLAADVGAIGQHLARDPLLAPLLAARPGLRAPGGWDGFEVATRIVLGQQITVAAAQKLAGRLVQLCGVPLEEPEAEARLRLAFPGPAAVLAADLEAIGMPAARREALRSLARAALAEPRLFEPLGTVEHTVARLRGIRGIGEWSAQFIALRAAREPDAFPAGDIGLLRGAAGRGARPAPEELLARAERWRPFRAYAAQHLWTADAEVVAARRGGEA